MTRHQLTLRVEGMTCGHCEKAIEKDLAGLAPGASVRADRTTGSVVLESEGPVDPEAVRARIRALGYQPVD